MRITNFNTGKSFFRKTRRRYEEPGDARELTFSCYQGFQFLSRDRTRRWFLDELKASREKWPFDLWAYVLMPEHVHLLIHPREQNLNVGRIVGHIKEGVARQAIAYLADHAPDWIPRISVREGGRIRHRFWQPGGGYDRNGIELATVHQMIAYIHANPVRRGLVACAEDWEWSSARWYAGIRPVLIDMDQTIPTMHNARY
jgi:putative transposase